MTFPYQIKCSGIQSHGIPGSQKTQISGYRFSAKREILGLWGYIPEVIYIKNSTIHSSPHAEMAFKRPALKGPEFFQWGSLSVKRVRVDATKHTALGPGDQ